MPSRSLLLVPVVLLVACGGGTPATTTTGAADSVGKAAAAQAAAAAAKAAAKTIALHAFDTAAAAGVRPLVRETYQYESAGSHDPFLPVTIQLDRGPELADLRLVAILYDPTRPSGSIATFRDIGDNKRYTLVPGQRLGRLSVASIAANTVKLREDDFGTTREQTYSLRKPGDETP